MTALLRFAIVPIVFGLLSAPAKASIEPQCHVPQRFYASEPPLVKTPKALADGRSVVIVVIGGASSLGLAAGGVELAWPARLESLFKERFPSARTRVINLAVSRQTAKRAAERLDGEILPLKPRLVIWETGTMEAVRRINVDEFRATVQGGIEKIRAAGAEVMLMNMQFSRETDAVIQFEPYLIAMRELSAGNRVPLFQRYAIMRYWVDRGLFDLTPEDTEDRRRVAGRLYDCISRTIGDFVTYGQHSEKRTTADVLRR